MTLLNGVRQPDGDPVLRRAEASTRTSPSATSTPCRSRGGTRCSTRPGCATWWPSTGATSSWPRRPRRPAGWTPCWLRPARSRRRRTRPPGPSARSTRYFATNGTSTSNKIVVQALTKPDDIVLIDRNCHKSHHYGLVLGGAHPVYLDAYKLPEFAMYGAVPLRTIKQTLLDLQAGGPARRGADAAAHQLHLRRHHLRPAAGDDGGAGDQARHGLPVGRGLVRLRGVRALLPAAHGDGLGPAAAGLLRTPGVPGRVRGARRDVGCAGPGRRRHLARPPPDARPRPRTRARLRHPVDAQVTVRAAAGRR